MSFFPWRRKKEKPKDFEINAAGRRPRKNLEELLKSHRVVRFMLSLEAQKYQGNVPENNFELKWLREIEEQIIELLPDKFQRDVFRIIAKHKFDITDLLGEESWEDAFLNEWKEICYFLENCAIYPGKSEFPPLPFRGTKLMKWFLAQAKNGQEETRVGSIFSAWSDAYKKGEVLDHVFREDHFGLDGITNRILVILAGESAKHSAVLIDIFCEVEGGEEYVIAFLNRVQESLDNDPLLKDID